MVTQTPLIIGRDEKKTRDRNRSAPMLFDEFALAMRSGGRTPTHFLIDHARFPGEPPTTTDLAKILRWAERTGPWKFLQKFPHLKANFAACRVPPCATNKLAAAASRLRHRRPLRRRTASSKK